MNSRKFLQLVSVYQRNMTTPLTTVASTACAQKHNTASEFSEADVQGKRPVTALALCDSINCASDWDFVAGSGISPLIA